MQPLILIGGGGHARAVVDVIERTGAWRIVGVIDPQLPRGEMLCGYPSLGGDDELARIAARTGASDRPAVHVTIGQIKSARPRQRMFDHAIGLGFEAATIISPLACVSRHAELGDGVTVMHFAAVGPGAKVGNNTIVNTRALVEHDSHVGNHCHISTTAVLNGDVEVGDGSFVGSGACVRQGARIGMRAVIGLGVRVLDDVPNDAVYIGKKT